jgi:hypothetical protein
VKLSRQLTAGTIEAIDEPLTDVSNVAPELFHKQIDAARVAFREAADDRAVERPIIDGSTGDQRVAAVPGECWPLHSPPFKIGAVPTQSSRLATSGQRDGDNMRFRGPR